jgi:hypothetical protein
MSILQKIVMHLWPRNTLKVAYLHWQAQENRLVEARQRLAREYLISRRQAEQTRLKVHQGILRAARTMLDQSLEPLHFRAKDRLQKAFALLGTGYCRRLPSPLDIELAYYITSIENLCRRHDELGVRLDLAREIIKIFEQTPEFCQPQFFRLALISPESAWLLFRLRHKRQMDSRAIQNCLAENWALPSHST